MTTNVRAYTISVWLTSVVLSPVIIFLYDHFNRNNTYFLSGADTFVMLFFVTLILGGLMSIPSVILLNICCTYLVQHQKTMVGVKVPLTLISILLTYAPIWVMNGFGLGILDVTLFVPFCTTIVAGIWLYKLELLTVSKDAGDKAD